jgi:tetratricopeptide (TPR) repeat protein
MRHLAYVLYYRHAFEEAALQATKALSADPSDAQSYGIMGDAYYEMGQYDRAQEAYERMIALRKDLYSYSRLAGLKSIRGDVEGAIADLEKAIQDGRENSRPGESIAWIQWQLGMEHFAIGNLKEAEGKFTEALKSHPDYYRALAGLGLVRGSQKRYPEAIDLYRKAIATNPHPNYIAALGDVYQKAGRFDEAQKQYSLIEQMDPKAANKNFDERDLAYFYADHDIKLNESLELAKMELEERKDIYAYDLMAWTLYKNGKPQEALTAITEALKLGTKDAKLFFHAGMIYYRLGEAERAKIYLRRALATNPYFHPFFVDVVENTFREIDQGGLPHSSIK